MLHMLLRRLGEYQNIIQVHIVKFIHHVPQHIIHESLEVKCAQGDMQRSIVEVQFGEDSNSLQVLKSSRD